MFETSRQGAVDVVTASHPLTSDYVEELRGVFESFEHDGQPHVVLDLQGTPLIDSTGLELLLDTGEAFGQLGGALKLAAPNPLCAESLKVTGVGNHFEMFADARSAVSSFAR